MSPARAPATWICRDRAFDTRPRPLIMGIVNVTPDSFSDGGRYLDAEAAVAHAMRLLDDGADLLDIGGESTRPGAEPIDADAECGRIIPVIQAIREHIDAPISVDTVKASVARAALEAGACIVNDVSACTADPDMIKVISETRAGVVLMHMQGSPRTMQDNPRYDDVVSDVRDYLAARMASLEAAGIAPERMALDPGIGFGKTLAHNTRLLGRLRTLAALGRPVVVGLSRKRMLGDLTGRAVGERLAAGLAGLAWCVLQGAGVLRVHDVAESRDAVRVLLALREQGEGA
jgi:dihydropteroate synthase